MTEISRPDLYNLVWSTPMARLGPKLGVSDVAIAKACKRMNIPRPAVGYWARRTVGKEEKPPPLPAADGIPTEWQLPVARPGTKKPSPEKVPLVEIAPSLISPHKLIAKTERALRRAEANRNGVVIPVGQGRLNVEVAPESIDRSLRVLDALVIALEERGHQARSGDGYQHETLIQVGNETVSISLREKLDRRDHIMSKNEKEEESRWGYTFAPMYDFAPTGALRIRITGIERSGARQSWSDGKSSRLEDKLGQVIVGIENAAEVIRADREEAARWRREWEERRMREQETEIRRAEERLRVEKLQGMARDWHESESIQRFVDHVESSAAARGGIDQNVAAWLTWARAQAQRLDPTGHLFVGDTTELVDEWKMGKVGTNPN